MDFPILIETIPMELPMCILKGCRSSTIKWCISVSIFLLANNADPDKMPHYAVFHLSVHWLPKNLFVVIKNGNLLAGGARDVKVLYFPFAPMNNFNQTVSGCSLFLCNPFLPCQIIHRPHTHNSICVAWI